jgi:hypothetical protein
VAGSAGSTVAGSAGLGGLYGSGLGGGRGGSELDGSGLGNGRGLGLGGSGLDGDGGEIDRGSWIGRREAEEGAELIVEVGSVARSCGRVRGFVVGVDGGAAEEHHELVVGCGFGGGRCLRGGGGIVARFDARWFGRRRRGCGRGGCLRLGWFGRCGFGWRQRLEAGELDVLLGDFAAQCRGVKEDLVPYGLPFELGELGLLFL